MGFIIIHSDIVYFAILLQISGFAQILISGYSGICRIFGAKTLDIFSHDKILIIGYLQILNPGNPGPSLTEGYMSLTSK
jgi:hypothetical protein